MITILALLATSEAITTKFVPSGVVQRVGGYMPIRVELTEDASLVKKAPEGVTAAKYGKIQQAGKTFVVLLDEPEGKPARMFVDVNGDGDLTNDPAANWKPSQGAWYMGDATLDLGEGRIGKIGAYRFDPKDPQRAALKNVLLYYADFGVELGFNLDGKKFSTFVAGDPASARSLAIDRNGDGDTSYNFETVQIGKPFNFTGTTYVFESKAGALELNKSTEKVERAPMPPDLRVGQKALKFKAKATDGKEISFPESYKGKIVMLDFWATWCGPCIAELPNVKKAYAKYHDQGFEILGISFDQANMAEKLAEFTKSNEMPWRQVYEGKFWETTLGKLHDVSGIPFVLLVDGDTGEILANAETLRGEQIVDTIGKALAKKKGTR